MDTSSIRAPASLVSEPTILGPMAQLQRPSDSYAWYSNQFYYHHSPSPQHPYPSTVIHGSTLSSVHNPYYLSPPQSYTLSSAYNTLHQPPFNYSHFLPPAAGPPTPLSFLPPSQSVTYYSQQDQHQHPPYIHQHNSYELQRLSTWKNDDKNREHQVFDKMPKDKIFQQFNEDDQICEVVETDCLTTASASNIVENPEKFADSEVDLHEDLQKLKVLAGAPKLYPEIVASNSVPLIAKTVVLKTVSDTEEDAMEDDIASDIYIEEDRVFDAGFVMEEISKVKEDENSKSFIEPKKPNKRKREYSVIEKLTSEKKLAQISLLNREVMNLRKKTDMLSSFNVCFSLNSMVALLIEEVSSPMSKLHKSMKHSQADLPLKIYQVLELEMHHLQEIQTWQVSAIIELDADMQRFSRLEKHTFHLPASHKDLILHEVDESLVSDIFHERVTLRWLRDEDDILCTKSKTYAIEFVVIKIAPGNMELAVFSPRLDKLKQLLLANPFGAGEVETMMHDDDDDNDGKKDWAFDDSDKYEVVNALVADEFPSKLASHYLQMFGSNVNKTDKWKLKTRLVCLHLARQILREERMRLERFIEEWEKKQEKEGRLKGDSNNGILRNRPNGARSREETFDEDMAIGRVLYELQLFEEALVSFKRACELQPTDVRPRFRTGNYFYLLGKYKGSKYEFLLALEEVESGGNQWSYLLPQIYVNLGIVLEEKVHRGAYISLREVAFEVQKVIEFLVGQIEVKINAGKDRFLSQVECLEYLVYSWDMLRRFVEFAKKQVMLLKKAVNYEYAERYYGLAGSSSGDNEESETEPKVTDTARISFVEVDDDGEIIYFASFWIFGSPPSSQNLSQNLSLYTASMEVLQPDQHSLNGYDKSEHKRKLIQADDGPLLGSVTPEAKRIKSSPSVIDYSEPFVINNTLESLDAGEFGSVTKNLQEIPDMRMKLVKQCIWLYSSLENTIFGIESSKPMELMKLGNQQVVESVINWDDDDTEVSEKSICVVPSYEVVILDYDDENTESQSPKYQFQSSLVHHQKNQGDATPVTSQCAFEKVVLGRGKEMFSALKGI